jgi:hypothetical protein
MRIIHKMFLLMAVASVSSCENGSYPVISDSESFITGVWINPVYIDTICQYERSIYLKEDGAGIGFKSGGEFVERKNAGWCGTPPVSYANYDGTWTQNDSMLYISTSYWGGTVDYEWKIISVDLNILRIYRVKDTFHYTE